VDFPVHWAIQNSYGHGGGLQSWESPDLRWLPLVFTGGTAWATYSVVVHGHPLSVISRGKEWAFPDTSLVGLLEPVMIGQEHFWDDRDRAGFWVVSMPLQNR
jgi:hypothetical protein